MAESATVKVAIEDQVAILTIDHPPANALDRATLRALDGAIDELLVDHRVKVIIVTGAGRFAFVVGADIKELATIQDVAEAHAFALLGQGIFHKLEASPKPVIAAINAYALGGGFELALACHIRILSDLARIGQPESNLGLIPGWGGTQRLTRLIGTGRALEMILTGDQLDASEAFRLGLVNRVAPAGQELDDAKTLARKIAGKSGLVIQAALRAVMGGSLMPLAEGLLHEADQFSALIGSHDTAEGLAAHLGKRKPTFTDA